MHVTLTAEKGAEVSSKVANVLKGTPIIAGIDADAAPWLQNRHCGCPADNMVMHRSGEGLELGRSVSGLLCDDHAASGHGLIA